MTPEERLQRIFDFLNEGLTKADFESAFEEVVKIIENLNKNNVKEFDAIHKVLSDFAAKLKEESKSDTEEIRKQCQKMMDKMHKEQASGMNFIRDKVKTHYKGLDGKPGMDGLPGAPGKDGSPDTPLQVRDKLESLEGEERLDKTAVKGIEQIEERIGAIEIRPNGRTGQRGFTLYVDGHKKLLTAGTLNLVAGTGISLTYAFANGRNDITISATSSGAFTVLAATGTVDDSNTSFTFVSAPSLVVVNGTSYRDGHGVTIVGTTATLDNPVGSGGDIYGIG